MGKAGGEVHTHDYDREAFASYDDQNGLKFRFCEAKLTADTAELARGAEAVCLFVNDKADAGAIRRLHELGVRLIALRCAGYNNVDLAAAWGRIHVVRVPAYSPHAVAEHAMALLLCSVRRIHKAYNRTREFNFSLNGLTGFDLFGKTVGIVGTGKIGQAFLRICQGFGMRVLAYDRFPASLEGVEYTTLERLLAESDIISLHCPLTPETHHMIDGDSIARMKPGVILLNTSRGALIDSDALLAGIKERKIGAACLDVYEEESDFFFQDFSGHIVGDDVLARLITMPNVIVTSHQAFLTREALDGIARTTVDNILDFFAHQRLENEICYRCGSQDTCRTGNAPGPCPHWPDSPGTSAAPPFPGS